MPILVRSAMPASERCGMNEPNTRLGWPLIRKTRSQIRTNPSSSPLARIQFLHPTVTRLTTQPSSWKCQCLHWHPGYSLFTMSRLSVIPRIRRSRGGTLLYFIHRCIRLVASRWRIGGARRDRTDDLKLAKLALSQLSYGPDPSAWQRSRRSSSNLQGAHTKSGGPGKI